MHVGHFGRPCRETEPWIHGVQNDGLTLEVGEVRRLLLHILHVQNRQRRLLGVQTGMVSRRVGTLKPSAEDTVVLYTGV